LDLDHQTIALFEASADIQQLERSRGGLTGGYDSGFSKLFLSERETLLRSIICESRLSGGFLLSGNINQLDAKSASCR